MLSVVPVEIVGSGEAVLDLLSYGFPSVSTAVKR